MKINWPKLRAIMKFFWLASSVLIYTISMIIFDGKPNSETELYMIFPMLALGFPLSYLGAAILSFGTAFLYHRFNIVLKVSYVSISADWFILFVFGYFQWFMIVPYLIRKIVNKDKKIPT